MLKSLLPKEVKVNNAIDDIRLKSNVTTNKTIRILKKIQPKTEREVLKLSITTYCETPIKQTHTKPQEMLEVKLTKSRERFQFNPPLTFQGSWMIRLTSPEVYDSSFHYNRRK